MKHLWIVAIAICLVFNNCFRQDGDIIVVNCQLLDAHEIPLQNVTVALVTMDSTQKINVEQELKTKAQGKVSFSFTYQSKLKWFLKAADKGSLHALNMPQISQVERSGQEHFVIHYDSLVPLRVRLKHSLPNMNLGMVSFYTIKGEKATFEYRFPITTNAVDTILQGSTHSHLEVQVWGAVRVRDSFIANSFIIPKGARRDTVFTLRLQR